MKTYKTTWDMGLLYTSSRDPQIEKDIQSMEKACAAFEKKYKKADYISTPQKLATALHDWEVFSERMMGHKPSWYFALKSCLDSGDNEAQAAATRLDQRITDAENKVTFFTLGIAKIPKAQQKTFLKEACLKPYAYFLQNKFKKAAHYLSEGEEQLSDLLSQSGYSMWVEGQQKLLSKQTIEHKGEVLPVEKALSLIAQLPKDERRELYAKINAVFKSISHFAEAEINAVFNYKKVMDERRGYAQPYTETIEAYENDVKSIEAFVDLVTKSFRISRRFYTLHAKLLGEKTITSADRNVPIGKIDKTFDFNASVDIVRETFAKIQPSFAKIFDDFLANGQIDVYPRKGKMGGAFCWGRGTHPTFVLLNHGGDLNALETLAHEMGHAVHTELSKTQSPLYRLYSIATAEVASTFFEQVVSDHVETLFSEEEKIISLHSKLKGDVSTIFRQIAFFNFEKELHERIRKEGQVSAEVMAEILVKHLRSYAGDSVEVAPEDGYFFVAISHIRSFFYVYSYAYGQLISRALYEKWKADPSYAAQIEQFLRAGKSMSPEDIFKKIGIDTSKPAFFEAGLKSLENDIKRLEKMAKKAGRI